MRAKEFGALLGAFGMCAFKGNRLASKAAAFGGLAVLVALAAGCSSTIHTKSNIADVDTLSVDAKQRLVLVANRSAGDGERVTCTEPMPDAIVARAAVLSGSGTFNLVGGNSGGGGASGGSAESAASIGFRNETVQMLRDGYYRLCEAYLNGALTTEQYQHMILNADTFMVVISALQTLGDNPIAQPVGIATGGPTATPASGGAGTSQAPGISIAGGNVTFPTPRPVITPRQQKSKSAEMASRIVRDYLAYRYRLAQIAMRERLALDKKRSATKSY